MRRIRDWPFAARAVAAFVPVAVVVLVLQSSGSDDPAPTRPIGTTTVSPTSGAGPAPAGGPTEATSVPPGQPDPGVPAAGGGQGEDGAPVPTIGAGSVPSPSGAPAPTQGVGGEAGG